jgi:hypothetical protein
MIIIIIIIIYNNHDNNNQPEMPLIEFLHRQQVFEQMI